MSSKFTVRNILVPGIDYYFRMVFPHFEAEADSIKSYETNTVDETQWFLPGSSQCFIRLFS